MFTEHSATSRVIVQAMRGEPKARNGAAPEGSQRNAGHGLSRFHPVRHKEGILGVASEPKSVTPPGLAPMEAWHCQLPLLKASEHLLNKTNIKPSLSHSTDYFNALHHNCNFTKSRWKNGVIHSQMAGYSESTVTYSQKCDNTFSVS